MRSLGLGLVIGLVMGAGAMYLVLRPPWGGQGAAPSDAGAVAAAGGDAGSAKPKKKHGGGGHRRPAGGGQPVAGGNDDQQWANQGDGPDEPEGPALVQLTAADRALEWQGDDVSPPPRKIDMESNARALDDAEIQSTISGQSAAAQSCVVQAATNTALAGTITVKMVVDDKGRITRSKLQAPHYLFAHGLLSCMKGALGRMKFPATGMPTLVTMPINFS